MYNIGTCVVVPQNNKQEIIFTGSNEVDFKFSHDSHLEEGERLSLEVDDEHIIYFSDKEARALANFLKSVTE